MSKKDYIALAILLTKFREQMLKDAPCTTAAYNEIFDRDLIVPLAHVLKVDNPAFDYARFLAYCGVKAEVE